MATNNKLNKFKMKKIGSLSICASIYLAQLFSLTGSAIAIPNSNEIIKYFNPVHEKSYLNEKQDRIIKKKSFKTQELEGLEPIYNRDIGLFATLDTARLHETNYIEHLLANAQINGLACLLPWQALEPEEDVFDWKTIDELLSLCARHHKQLILRVSTCGMDLPPIKQTTTEIEKSKNVATAKSDTPAWVFEAGTQSITYTGKDGNSHLMPIFWDGTYLAKWSNFVNELGKRYDKNTSFQSIGVTGGGVLGGTKIVPEFTGNKDAYDKLESELKEKRGMNPVQLASHWKYVADVFPKAFPTQHLNFDIDPPLPNRKGQDCLDEISDYLIYRYGQRVYVVRQNIKNEKRGFDEYRLLLKYKNDTLTGYQVTSALASSEIEPLLPKITKNALDDGISFAEIPAEFFDSKNEAIKQWLTQMRLYVGYQLVLQELTLPASIEAGNKMPVHFAFINTGAASAKRPQREMDKAIPSSYKIQLELKDGQGKTKALVRHTPDISTFNWLGSKPITWEQNLKIPPLKPGKYDVHLAIIDDQTNYKLNYCRAISGQPKQIGNDLLIGSIEILATK